MRKLDNYLISLTLHHMRLHKTLVLSGVCEVDGETQEKAIKVLANLVGEDAKITWKTKRSVTIFAHYVYGAAGTSYVRIKSDDIYM